jgi:murein DD-endopeptidase MepM/ murein hydrolase activator NlpD
MAKIRYIYNSETCKYDPIIVLPKDAGRKILIFLSISFIIGLIGLVYFNSKFPHLDETLQTAENQKLKTEWKVLLMQLERTSQQLSKLEQNDDHNYRVILDLEPLDINQREAGVGGRAKESSFISNPFIRTAYERSEKIKNRLDIEAQSMKQLKEELERKEKMWASRPAIQPIDNKQLTRLHTIFGLRLHPKHGDIRAHNGLDFTAPTGTPVYATGDGKVEKAYVSTTYGNVIYMNHGFQFETRYAHLNQYIVKDGEKIKRGQIIGYVGDTGTSVGPHLHYEVLYKGSPVNPINFFQRDLNNKEYEKLIELGSRSVSSLD